jgi:hypothetical protein
MHKTYLGDGVYVKLSPSGMIVLTTENGIETTNTVFLEPEVWQLLLQWVNRLSQKPAHDSPSPGGEGRGEGELPKEPL